MDFHFLNTALRFKRDSLRIVYYHIVSTNDPEYYFDNKIISPTVFRKHLSLFEKNFEIISLTEALQMAGTKASLRRKMVLTFDDGFKENYSVIAPILKERGIPATFFLIGNCIDNRDLMWRNKLIVLKKKVPGRLPELIDEATGHFHLPSIYHHEDIMSWSFRAWPMSKKDEIASYLWNIAAICPISEYLEVQQPYLTINQIRCLLSEGFEIGSHSMSHPIFSRLSYVEFEYEILASIRLLETTFNSEITSFSYPFGIKASSLYEQQLLGEEGLHLRTFLGTKNRLNNYQNSLQWERDNLEFPMNKMLFRLNILPLLRRFADLG